MTRAVIAGQGGTLPAVQYADSVVLQTSGVSQSTQVPSRCQLVTITVTADTWMRVGLGTISADGAAGCDLIPAGCKWTEGVPYGAQVALATVDGSAALAVLRFASD